MATEQGLKESEHGANLVYTGKEVIEKIILQAERTVQLASAISMAMSEQNDSNEQIVVTMTQLANAMNEGVMAAKQNSSLAVALADIAQQLKEQSKQFVIERDAEADSNPTEASDLGSWTTLDDALVMTAQAA
jgi:methyl-accepting chemotaxis protein